MLFGLFNGKKNKDKGNDENVNVNEDNDIKQYAVDISTNFDDDDREYCKPIYTIKYYSKLNPSVINEVIFSKNIETGCLTLNEAFLALEEILKKNKEYNLLINTMINENCVLTNEEENTIKELEDLVK